MGDLSPFPAAFFGVDLYIGGVWTAVPWSEISDDGITIVRGRSDEGARVDPARMTCRLKNPTGKYSPRNPNSSLYGLIARNTPVRSWVALGQPRLVQDAVTDFFSCPDSVATSVTGDIDLRVDVDMPSWRPLVSAYVGIRKSTSYGLYITSDGFPGMEWYDAGSVYRQIVATRAVGGGTVGRKAIRVTLDVDNGAAGRTATFYTSDTISGTWTQLGDPVVQAGTTAIFNGTTALESRAYTGAGPADVYALEVRSGIGGTVVANPVFTGQANGATSFTDGAGNTWTVQGAAQLWNRHYRFWGEVTAWPQRWTKTGAAAASTPIECAGVLRRLGQGSSPLRSALYRTLSKIGTNLVAYWPVEDLENASTYTAAVPPTGRGMVVSGTPTNAGYTGFVASAPIVTLESGRLTGLVPSYTGTGFGQVRWITRIPASTPTGAVLARVRGSGTLGWADVRYNTGGGITVEAFTDAGTSVGTNTYALAVDGKKLRCSLELTQSGGNINWTFATFEVGAAGGSTGTGTFTGVTLGAVTSVELNPNKTALAGVAAGHVTVEKAITTLFDVSAAVLAGYTAEKAAARVKRLAGENAVTVAVLGIGGGGTALGAQGRADLVTLLHACVDADGGILYEPRTSDDLAYRTLEAQYSQTPAVTIAYTDNLLLPFEPVDDDQGTRNKVTVTREGGSSATVEETDGALSTLDPPAGVGIYDEDVTLSLAADVQCVQQAGWRVRLGTTDEARWPVIGLDLAHPTFLANASLTRQILTVDLGDRLDVTGIPVWLPPLPVTQIVQGTVETIDPWHHRIEFNCTPARPYRAGFWNEPTDRWSNDSSTLASSATSGATSWSVAVPILPLWTSVDGSFDLLVAGERVTVTAVAGAASPQTFTVVRSVNGVVKAQTAGTPIALYDPALYGL
jgi:hypothetical protein